LLKRSAHLAIDLLLVTMGDLESDANHLDLGRVILVWVQSIDDPVAGVHIPLLVEVELAAIGEIPRAERETAWLSEPRILLRNLDQKLNRPALQSRGGKLKELLLGAGVEEIDREPRHLQAKLRRIESGLARDISQLNPLARVFGKSLAYLLRSDQLVEDLGNPLVPLIGEDHALGLPMRAKDDWLCLVALLAEKLQIARETLSRLGTWDNGLGRTH
jgi:hypothetical protein